MHEAVVCKNLKGLSTYFPKLYDDRFHKEGELQTTDFHRLKMEWDET
jgi:hypothetical protein